MPSKAMGPRASPSPKGKKRSASTFSSGDENKKTRGRPRVEPQDQTAADRRRTQIRLAQRSYRQRKEGTITDLQTKVSQLEIIISEMNDTYQDLKQNAASSNISNADFDFNQKLTEAAERFMELTRTVKRQKIAQRASSDEYHPELSPEDLQSPQTISPSRNSSHIFPKAFTPAQPKKLAPTIVSTSERGVPSVWGYETIYQSPTTDYSSQSTVNPVVSQDIPNLPLEPFNQSQALISHTNFLPSFGPPTPFADPNYFSMFNPNMEMPSPTSYAHLEDSFARRLNRSIVECAVTLLSLTHPPANRIRKVFGHVMKYYSQYDLRQMFIESLQLPPNEPIQSRSVYPYMGPLTSQHWLVDPKDEKAQSEMLSAPDNKDDNAWFRPNDVQRYLEQKGIHVPRGASYVDWEYQAIVAIGPSSHPWPSPAASSNGEVTPNQFDGHVLSMDPAAAYELQQQSVTSVSQTQPQPSTPASSMEGENSMNPPMAAATMLNPVPYMSSTSDTYFYPPVAVMNQDGSITSRPKFQRIPAKFTVDILKFMDQLRAATCCLGKTPGFRRRDVETAFANSLIQMPIAPVD